MKINKRWLVVGLVTGLAALALTTGAIWAQTATATPAPGATAATIPANSLAARLGVALGIDPAKVQAAIDQVRQQQQTDAVKARLDALVKAGKITQAQEDSYLSWLAARPNIGLRLFGGLGGGHRGGEGLHRVLPRGHDNDDAPGLAPTATPHASV